MLSHYRRKRGRNIEKAYCIFSLHYIHLLWNELGLFVAIFSLSLLSPWLHAFLKAGNIPASYFIGVLTFRISSFMEYTSIFKFYYLLLSLLYLSEKCRDLFNPKHLDTPRIMKYKPPASSIGTYYMNASFFFQS